MLKNPPTITDPLKTFDVSQGVTLVVIHNPFDIHNRTIKKVTPVSDLTLGAFSEIYLPKIGGVEYHVSLNGKVIGDAELGVQTVRNGDFVAVCPVIMGGGGGGKKNPLAILASIALSVFATFVVDPAVVALFSEGSKAGVIAGRLAAGATFAIGGQLISSAFAPSFKMQDTANDSAYSWSALQPIQNQGAAMPITYGTVMTAGQVLAQHVSYEVDDDGDDIFIGDEQYLSMLLCGGEGPIDDIFDIKVNGNPIGNFQGVSTTETRLGTNDQATIADFNEIYDDAYFQYGLEVGRTAEGDLHQDMEGEWSEHQTEGEIAEYLEVQIDLAAGLYEAGGKGNYETWIELDIEYKPVSAGHWTTWVSEKRIEAKKTKPATIYLRKQVDSNAGRYSVRMRMRRKKSVFTSHINMTTWTRLSAIIQQPMSHPNKALLGIKIKATDQLSNGMPTVTWKQTRSKVLVYENGRWVEKDARNPAWIIYDLCVKARPLTPGDVHVYGEDPQRIDLPRFQAWAEWNDRELANRPAMQMNLMVDAESSLWDWVNRIAASARGAVVLKGTKISCIWDQPSVPVQLFSMGNIKALSFGGEYLPLDSRANAVEISFLNEAKNYEREQVTVYMDGYDSNMANPTSIELVGITDFERAYREGVYHLNQNKYLLRTVSFEADVDAIACQVGDVIQVQHDIPQWGQGGRILTVTGNRLKLDHAVSLQQGETYQILVRTQDDRIAEGRFAHVGPDVETDEITISGLPGVNPYDPFSLGVIGKAAKPFRVQSISRTGDLTVSLTCSEYIEEVYTETGKIPVIEYSGGVNLVSNLELKANGYYSGSGVWVPELWAHWNYRGKKPIAYDVEWKQDDDLWGSRKRVSEPTAQCPLRDTTALYSVRVRGVYSDRLPSDWAYATFESAKLGNGIEPGKPTDLTVVGWFGFAQLSWKNPDSVDLACIEIWEADEDNRKVAKMVGQAAAPAESYTRLFAAGAAKWYWIRAVSHTGMLSGFNRPEGTPCVISPESHEIYVTNLLENNPYLSDNILQLQERIAPIEVDLNEITTVKIPDLTSRVEDAETEINDRLEPALDIVSSGVLRLADEADRTRNVFRWAGVEVNETAGTVVIRGLEDLKTETGYQFSEVEQRLDAQRADINLRATRVYVDELAATLISSVTVAEQWKFAGALYGWTAQNATLTAEAASMKYAVTAASPSLTSPDISLDGATNNIIGLQIRQASGPAAVPCRIQYRTAEHGYSDDYMKRVTLLGSANAFRSVQVNMHGLDAGGSDWQNSTVTGIRILLGEGAGEAYDIALVNVGQSTLTDLALEDLKLRITQAELDIDGANAAIALKADETTMAGLAQRLSSAEIDIDGLKSQILLKAERTELSPLTERLTQAEVAIDALDGSIRQEVFDYKVIQDQVDELAGANIQNSVNNSNAEEKRRVAIAQAKQELHAEITETNEALATYNLELTAAIGDNAAAVVQEAVARANAIEAEALERKRLASKVDGNAAAIERESITRANELGAEASARELLVASVGENKAAIEKESSARIEGDKAEAKERQKLELKVNGQAAAIETEAEIRKREDGKLEAKYGVRLDKDGLVSGFVQNNDGKQSDFIISTDYFFVTRPGFPKDYQKMLTYDSSAGRLSLHQIAVDGAYIKNGSINTAQIKDAAINSAKITDGAITNAKIGSAAIDEAKIKNLSVSTLKIQDRAVTIPQLWEPSNSISVSGTASTAVYSALRNTTVSGLALGQPIVIFMWLQVSMNGGQHYKILTLHKRDQDPRFNYLGRLSCSAIASEGEYKTRYLANSKEATLLTTIMPTSTSEQFVMSHSGGASGSVNFSILFLQCKK